MAIEYQQQTSLEAKPMEHQVQAMVHQFPSFGDQPPNSVLQLATIPPQIYPYHLQLAQPSLQE